jgi:hypothetical protein
MRSHILIALLRHEACRRLTHRGGLLFVAVLALVTGGMAFLIKGSDSSLGVQVETCFVDYWQDGPWIDYLRASVPSDLAPRIKFRAIEHVAAAGEEICYPAGAGAIQLRSAGDGRSGSSCKVWIWYPGTQASGVAVFESWFWQETARYFRLRWNQMPSFSSPNSISEMEVERSALAGSAETHTTGTTALLIFPIFLTCVYLLPTWMCEDRERGLLVAMALTPATPLELLTARSLFSAILGMALAAGVAGVSHPAVLGKAEFWIALSLAALGAAGVGATIGCLVSRQRTASLAALGYMAVVAGIMSAGPLIGLPGLSWLTLEGHVPSLLHGALTGASDARQGGHLIATVALCAAWLVLAATLFRKRGWQ